MRAYLNTPPGFGNMPGTLPMSTDNMRPEKWPDIAMFPRSEVLGNSRILYLQKCRYPTGKIGGRKVGKIFASYL